MTVQICVRYEHQVRSATDSWTAPASSRLTANFRFSSLGTSSGAARRRETPGADPADADRVIRSGVQGVVSRRRAAARHADVLAQAAGSAQSSRGDHRAANRGLSRVNHECELGIVIGKKAKCVTPEEAADYIFGYTCYNDLTRGDLYEVARSPPRPTSSTARPTMASRPSDPAS